ncbi:MAG: dimethyl sulfoxide reductase anchor subunit [Pirellulales bacterium]|nr:dimethyl sulfoxide reductase anchor subunit [Pirellulales bacterium]
MIELSVIDQTGLRADDVQRRSDASGLGVTSLLDALLAEQQNLAAVEVFSCWHDGVEAAASTLAPRYRALLPAEPPGPGEQYAFEVDLDRCSGCKACVTACHTRNGLDELEAWRDVGLLIGGSRNAPFMQHVTAACHHCLDPACLAACPVNAYEKDPATGIVRHLDDQCFGCQYCTLACPYDVPKYHAGKGIVRKCDMCSQRLAVGEAPACVQACPHEAIAIRIVNHEQVIEDTEAAVFLPAAPDPLHTYPTTTYKTARAFPRNLLPADYCRVNPQHAHWPLVVMLVLTQMSVGAFVVGLIHWQPEDATRATQLRPLHAMSSLAFGLLALSASLFHLGRPQYAFRAVLGLRHSWLSREILAFGAFAQLASAYAVAQVAVYLGYAEARHASLLASATSTLASREMGWIVTASGVAGVLCSVMIYVFTRRECWSASRTLVRFGLTAAVLGLTASWLSALVVTLWTPSTAMLDLVRQSGPDVCRAIIAFALLKLVWEAAVFRHLLGRRVTALRRSAMIQVGELSNFALARFALGLLGGVVMPCLLLRALPSLSPADLVSFASMSALLFLANLAGELLERYLFFAACAAPRMPGGIR